MSTGEPDATESGQVRFGGGPSEKALPWQGPRWRPTRRHAPFRGSPEVRSLRATRPWALRDAARAVDRAHTTGQPVNAEAIASARDRYDQGILVGISTNLSRRWHTGNHPGLLLVRRLQKKADQVWLYTQDLRVPWTNNASEQSLRMAKLQQKISNCWRDLTTAKTFCRVRSYLTTARNHGIRPLDALRDALIGTPWLPPLTA
jgi:transposase